MSEHYDVIVIGGGIAGLSTAANITEGDVLLLEKDKIKTEEKRYLRSTFMRSPERFGFSKCVLKKYDTYLLQSLTGLKLEIHFDDYELKLLDLGKINKFLKKEIERKSDIREKIEVKDVKFSNNKIEVTISDRDDINTLSTKYVIDASGTSFFTRKIFNLKCPDILCHCLSATFYEDYIGDPDILTYIMPTDEFKCGGWIFPFNEKDHHFGIADSLSTIESPSNVLNAIYDRTKKHPIFENMIRGNDLKKWDIGIIPIGYQKPLVYNRIAYVGDIVVQATPWLFEGIRPISEASIMCANVVNAALKNKNKSLLKKYEDEWYSTYGRIYESHHYQEKWNRTTLEWDKSLKRMSKIVDTDGKMAFLGFLKYDKMPENHRNYLRNLRSQFCQ